MTHTERLTTVEPREKIGSHLGHLKANQAEGGEPRKSRDAGRMDRDALEELKPFVIVNSMDWSSAGATGAGVEGLTAGIRHYPT